MDKISYFSSTRTWNLLMTKLNTDNRLDQYTVFNRHQAIERWISENGKNGLLWESWPEYKISKLKRKTSVWYNYWSFIIKIMGPGTPISIILRGRLYPMPHSRINSLISRTYNFGFLDIWIVSNLNTRMTIAVNFPNLPWWDRISLFR